MPVDQARPNHKDVVDHLVQYSTLAPSVKSHPGVGGISLSSQVLEELSTMIHGIDISLFS